METGKLKKRFWPAFVYLVILLLLTAVVEYAYYKDYAYYNIVCFAVDSRGRVLLGKVARVDIYENNVLTDSIEIPLRRAYSINPMRNGTLEIQRDSSSYLVNCQGEVLAEEHKEGGTSINTSSSNKYYTDIYGNEYRYINSLFAKRKIIKNGEDAVFSETEFNRAARLIKFFQLPEYILLICFFAGKGHPILFIKVTAYRLGKGKKVYFEEFDKYYNDYIEERKAKV